MKITKATAELGGTITLGVFSITGKLGLESEPNRVADVLGAAQVGISVCNIGKNVQYLDLVFKDVFKVKSEAKSKLKEAVEEIDLHAEMLQPNEVRTLEFHLGVLPDSIMVLLSVLLSVGNVLGRDAAVQVMRSFITKVYEAAELPLSFDKIRLDSELKSFIQNISAGGSRWVNVKASKYDAAATEGETVLGSRAIDKVTYGMMVSLVWWLYQGMKVAHDGEAEAELQICKTYDNRLHKVVHLLGQFGWPAHAALKETENDFGEFSRVIFQAHKCKEGIQDMPLLSPGEVEKHGVRVPQSGSWMICKYQDIGKVLRARIGNKNELGCNLESGWEEGWEIGMSRRVKVPPDGVHIELGDPTADAGDNLNLGCEYLLGTGSGGKLRAYAGRFHRMYGGNRKEYESAQRHHYRKLVPETSLQAALAGFTLGYLCGSVFAVARVMDLFAGDKDDVCLSWLDDMVEFLWLLDHEMAGRQFPVSTIGTFLDLIAACFYGEAQRLRGEKGRAVDSACVGTLAGDKLLLLEAVIHPRTNRLASNCRVLELDSLPINIPCRDGKYVVGAKEGFNKDLRNGVEINMLKPQNSVEAKPAATSVSFTIGPNLIDNDGSVMHSMYANGTLVHCASVLEAIPASKYCTPVATCAHRGREMRVYNPSGDLLAYSVSDTDLIEHGVLISPLKSTESGREPSRVGTVVVQVDGDDSWRYTAASMYEEYKASIADGCLACAAKDQIEVIIV